MRVLALVALFGLGCSGFIEYGAGDFEGATEAEVEARGYRIPDGAHDVYVKDRVSIDVHSTWLRYRLPPDAFEALRAQVVGHEGARRADDAIPPADWPTFQMFDAPEWWAPSGEVWRYETRASRTGDDDGRGSLWAFDADTHTVDHWMWTFQWWGVK